MYGLIAHIGFLVLVVTGWTFGELEPRSIGIIIGIWCAAFVASFYLPLLPFSSFAAVLDVVLVFMIFKGDMRLR